MVDPETVPLRRASSHLQVHPDSIGAPLLIRGEVRIYPNHQQAYIGADRNPLNWTCLVDGEWRPVYPGHIGQRLLRALIRMRNCPVATVALLPSKIAVRTPWVLAISGMSGTCTARPVVDRVRGKSRQWEIPAAERRHKLCGGARPAGTSHLMSRTGRMR